MKMGKIISFELLLMFLNLLQDLALLKFLPAFSKKNLFVNTCSLL